MTKPKQRAKQTVLRIDLSKLEAVAEQLEGLEERRDRIELIKSRGWA